jgi:hypothetical protein
VAYDEDLAVRVRELLAYEPDLEEKRMFGGLAFMLGGNMAVVVSGQGGLMVRVDKALTGEALELPGAEPFEMSGREVDGWVRVVPGALGDEVALREWVERGVGYAKSLPPKQG